MKRRSYRKLKEWTFVWDTSLGWPLVLRLATKEMSTPVHKVFCLTKREACSLLSFLKRALEDTDD